MPSARRDSKEQKRVVRLGSELVNFGAQTRGLRMDGEFEAPHESTFKAPGLKIFHGLREGGHEVLRVTFDRKEVLDATVQLRGRSRTLVDGHYTHVEGLVQILRGRLAIERAKLLARRREDGTLGADGADDPIEADHP